MDSPLPTLPPEVLSHICDMLSRKRDTARFMCVSHQLYGIGARYLYRDIDLLQQETPNAAQEIEDLATLFLRKPHLCGFVRNMAVRLPKGSRPVTQLYMYLAATDHREYNHARSPELEELIEEWRTVQDSNESSQVNSHDADEIEENDTSSDWVDTDDEWESDYDVDSEAGLYLPSGPMEHATLKEDEERWFILATLLTRFPNLQKLDLELPSLPRERLICLDQALDYHRTKGPTSVLFPHVKTICLGYSSISRRGQSYHGILAFMPSLTSVYLHRMAKESFGQFVADTRSLDITHLELRDCRVSPPSLQRMVAVPKALTSFVYELGEPRSLTEIDQPISYRSLRRALESQTHSLEQISIDYPHDYCFDDWAGGGPETRPMGSFSEFGKLKRLRIATTYVFGWVADTDPSRLRDSLPDQLEELHLTHADEDEETCQGLFLLLDAKRNGRFASLTNLSLECEEMWYLQHFESYGGKTGVLELMALADSLGIKMEIFNNHSDERIEGTEEWLDAAEQGFPERKEAGWGFNGDVVWPERVSGCIKRPFYPLIHHEILD